MVWGDYAIMFLSDNKRERTGEQYPIVVRDDWYYYKNDQDKESSSGSVRNVVSGETIALMVTGRMRCKSGQVFLRISRYIFHGTIRIVPDPCRSAHLERLPLR